MANARRGISELLRSGKGKRFRSSGYDLLADGEDLVRSDRDEDDEDERPAKGATPRKGAHTSVETKKPVASKATSNGPTGHSARKDVSASKPQMRAGASSRDDAKAAASSSKQVVAKKGTTARTATITEKVIVAKSATEAPKRVVAKLDTVAKKDVVAKTGPISEAGTTRGKGGSNISPDAPREEAVAKRDTVPKTDTVGSGNAWLPNGRMVASKSATIAKEAIVAKVATSSRVSDLGDTISEDHLADDLVVADSETIDQTDIVAKAAITVVAHAQQGVDRAVAETATAVTGGIAAANRTGILGSEIAHGHQGLQDHGAVAATIETRGVVAKKDTIANKGTSSGGQHRGHVVADVDTSSVSATVAETATSAPHGTLKDQGMVSEADTTSQGYSGSQSGYSSQISYKDARIQGNHRANERTVAESDTIATRDTAIGLTEAPAALSSHDQRVIAESGLVAEKDTTIGREGLNGVHGVDGRNLKTNGSQNGYYSQNSNHHNGHGDGGVPVNAPGLYNGIVPNLATVAERDTGFSLPGMPTAKPHVGEHPGHVVAKAAIGTESATPGFSGYQGQRMGIAETATVANSATHQARTPSYKGNAQVERTQPTPTLSNIPDHGIVPLPFWVLRMIRQDELSLREIRVFLTILEECIASGTGSAEISANDLMTRTQIHRTHIFSSVKGLLEKNLIVKDKTDAASKNVYRLNFDVGSAR